VDWTDDIAPKRCSNSGKSHKSDLTGVGDLNSLLIFAKAPLIGFVKTRLKNNSNLSNSELLELYRAFLKDTIQVSKQAGSDRVYLSCYPKEKKALMEEIIIECFGEMPKGFSVLSQVGEDFDERFTNAVREALTGCDNVVVIGSDSPQIQPGIIERSWDFLNKVGGMVLGPSKEGGVYLVGVNRPFDFDGIFTEGIELENLVALAEENQMQLLLLEELTDLDVSSDLINFICNIKAMEYAEKFNDLFLPEYTINFIRKIGLCVKSEGGGKRGRKLIKKS
jgi:glycosyltransferase A (GT-A) superfamily protein (DUF2064 family)